MNHNDPVFDLICQEEARLDGESSADASSSEDSLDALDADQRSELEKAHKALALLHRVRCNLGVLGELGDDLASESQVAAGDSTVKCGEKQERSSVPNVPSKLGRFEILDVLGQGGFNRVFLARDPQLDRLVALKVPRPSAIADASSRRRFEREALAAAALSHPAIVPIFETGTVGPVSYIAFAYCEGETLAGWIEERRGEVDSREAASIAARLAEAVEHAHRHGVIHRDLKPANILIEVEPLEEPHNEASIANELRITDFGLAKLEASDGDSLTMEGAIVGTPAYMSPEQARGETNISASSDIFALGAILYELLTGQRPFRGDTHLATLRAIETKEPSDPQRRGAPRDLAAICLKCLRKSPAERYESAHALAADLGRFLEGRPILARSAGRLERLFAWVRREPAIAASLSFAFASLVIGLAVAVWQLQESKRERQRAQRNLGRAQTVIDQMINDVALQLQHVPELKELRSSLVQQAVDLQEEILDESTDDPSVMLQTATAYRWQVAYRLELGDSDGALEASEQGLQLLDRVPAGFDDSQKEFLRRELQLARTSTLIRMDRQSEEVESEMVSSDPARNGDSSSEELVQLARGKYQEGNLKLRNGNYAGAIDNYQAGLDVLSVATAEAAESSAITVALHQMMGECHTQLGQYDVARQCADRAERVIHANLQLQPGHHTLIAQQGRIHTVRARIAEKEGNHERAAAEFAKARDRFAELVRQFPEKVGYVIDFVHASASLGTNLKFVDEDQAAEALHEFFEFLPTIASSHRRQPMIAINIAKAHTNRAFLFRQSGNYELALEQHVACKEMYEDLLASVDSDDRRLGLAWCLESYAITLVAMQRYAEARDVCEEAIEHLLASGQIETNDNEARNLNDVFWLLHGIGCKQRDYTLAAATIRRSLHVLPNRKLSAAEMCAKTAQAVARDESLEPSEQASLYDRLVRQCAQLLLQDGDGTVDLQTLQENESFAPLLDNALFTSLLSEG